MKDYLNDPFISEEGEAIIKVAKELDLARFYCKHTGNLSLSGKSYRALKSNIESFLDRVDNYTMVMIDQEEGEVYEFNEALLDNENIEVTLYDREAF